MRTRANADFSSFPVSVSLEACSGRESSGSSLVSPNHRCSLYVQLHRDELPFSSRIIGLKFEGCAEGFTL